MTQDELDALPDITPSIGQLERIVDGRRIVAPVAGVAQAMFTGPDDGTVMDANGAVWMVGMVDGVRCKRLTSYWHSERSTSSPSPQPGNDPEEGPFS